MFQLIESIRLEEGQFHNLSYHQARMNEATNDLFSLQGSINVTEHLLKSSFPKAGKFKCRVLYNTSIQSVEFVPYIQKTITTLKVVHDNEIEYGYKFEDRKRINSLFEQRQFCDDILIVKNGLVTDSSFSNIIFFDGYQWVTPDTPLLKGTMRQMLLDAAEIKSVQITLQNIHSFQSFRLINALLGFDGPGIDVSGIVF